MNKTLSTVLGALACALLLSTLSPATAFAQSAPPAEEPAALARDPGYLRGAARMQGGAVSLTLGLGFYGVGTLLAVGPLVANWTPNPLVAATVFVVATAQLVVGIAEIAGGASEREAARRRLSSARATPRRALFGLAPTPGGLAAGLSLAF